MQKEESVKNYTTKELIKDIWLYLKPYKGKFFLVTVFRILGSIVWLYPPYAIAATVQFFSTYKVGQSFNDLYVLGILYLLAVAIRGTLNPLGRVYGFGLGAKLNSEAEISLMKHLFLLDMSWHEKENSGNKMKRIDKGTSGMEKIIRMWVANFIDIGISFVGVIYILSKFDKLIAFLMIIFIITYYFISNVYRKKGVMASKVANIQDERVNGLAFESINNIRTVKVMDMSKNLLGRLKIEIDDWVGKINKRVFWFQLGGTINWNYAQLVFLAMASYIIYGLIQGTYEITFFILFCTYFDKCWHSIQDFAEVSDEFATAKNDISRMQELLKVPVTIDLEKGKALMPRDWQKISVEKLSFSYGDKNILDNISFEINRGEKIGIVGLSGAGKSTLFKLLLKENESYLGEILFASTFESVPLKEISKKDYLKHTAVVLQETELFNTSLRENIAINVSSETGSQVILDRAIEVAHVKDFMDRLPEGVESVVGEKGVKLSGGEKQRVGIARAVYKSPELLLMDEATSHLDIESEKKIQESLHEFFKEVTAVVIAHGLTTIKEMDKIIVLENGKIVETGSFKELIKQKGRFYELWEKQKL